MDSEDGEESEEEDRDKDVDPGFRQQLMEVLKAGNALGAGESATANYQVKIAELIPLSCVRSSPQDPQLGF